MAVYRLDYIAISAAVPRNSSLFITGKDKMEFKLIELRMFVSQDRGFRSSYFPHMACSAFIN